MKRRIIILLSLLIASVIVSAQNGIDRFVDNESTIGRSKFTSVVERDPQTRVVIRVVKVRELTRGIDINTCLGVFEKEQSTGRYSHRIEAGEQHTVVLAVDGERQNRVYMLQYTGDHPMRATDGKVTVVVRMKNRREE